MRKNTSELTLRAFARDGTSVIEPKKLARSRKADRQAAAPERAPDYNSVEI
jgi:hypothetical protein